MSRIQTGGGMGRGYEERGEREIFQIYGTTKAKGQIGVVRPLLKVLPEFLLPSDYVHGKWNHSQKPVFTQLLLVSSLLPASPSLSLLQPLKYSQISPEGVSILYAFLLLFPLAWKRLSLIHVNSY